MSEVLLPTIWFFLWGLLWAIYFALDGFDLGAGILAGLARRDDEQLLLIRSLGPIWDGNEVWVITAGGVTFAAFPKLYATMFSSLYLPLIIILLGLVLRAVAIEFYNLDDAPGWKRFWARVLAGASLVVALLFGVAFGNIFQGVPLDAEGYKVTLLTLLNPYGLLTGVLFVLAFLYNGAAWLAHKAADEDHRQQGLALASRLWPWFFGVAGLFLVATPFATRLVENYLAAPILFIIPLAAVGLLIGSFAQIRRGQPTAALITGSLTVLVTVMAAIVGLYPDMFPSSIDPAYSVTAFNAASSPYTLRLMLLVAVIFLPVVLVYQAWAYRLFGRSRSGVEVGY
nr:MAG: cytochrome d ubiquinol oxidase subunit II [Bacillota bacterium]